MIPPSKFSLREVRSKRTIRPNDHICRTKKKRIPNLSTENTALAGLVDGSITASDASNVLLAYAYSSTGKKLTLNMTQFDYNNDGIINSADSSVILEKYAELSTSK